MAAFGADGRCLMRALQEELDDPEPERLRPLLGVRRRPLRRPARPGAGARRRRCCCARGRSCSRPRRWRRTRAGRCARSPTTCAPRRAARWRGWATAAGIRWCRPGARAGRFDDELVAAAAEVVRAWGAPVAWVAAIPSRRSGALVPDFAARLAAALGLPYRGRAAAGRRRAAAARDGELGAAGGERARAVRGRGGRCRTAPCLLVDDVRFSGWTLAMVGGQLRRRARQPCTRWR